MKRVSFSIRVLWICRYTKEYKELSQNIIPGACAGVCDVSALGVEAPCGSVLGRRSNRGFGPDAVNDGRR